LPRLDQLRTLFHDLAHSSGPTDDAAIDAALGLRRAAVEAPLDLASLLVKYGQHRMESADSAYSYIRDLFQALPADPPAPVLDLGSGYGRIGFFGALAWSRAVTGIELVQERVVEANRVRDDLKLDDVAFIAGDLLATPWPEASQYLALNSVTPRLIEPLVEKLSHIARTRPIVIASVATANLAFRQQAWLREVVPDCPSAGLPAYLRLFFSN
jgi:hypothetical protein